MEREILRNLFQEGEVDEKVASTGVGKVVKR